jgi:hypothetical protein
MTATLNRDPIHKDRWLVSEAEGRAPTLGVQLGKPHSDLTVYWSSKVTRSQMFAIIREAAEAMSRNRTPVRGKFVAYGKDMRAVYTLKDNKYESSPDGTLVKSKDVPPLETFDACRAELTGSSGTVVVWANVNGPVRAGLDHGGENIGVSVPPDFFDGAGRSLISHAIEITMELRPNAISALLDKFSESLLHKRRPAAG